MKRILLVLFICLLLISFVTLFLPVRPGNLNTYISEFAIYNSPGQVYRFSWWETFGLSFTVRIQINDNGTADLFFRGEFLPHRGPLRSGRRRLNEIETLDFLHLLDETDFWSLPTEIDRIGVDGHRVIFEGIEDGTYHIVNRWVPTSDDPVSEIRQFFFDLAGQQFPVSRTLIRLTVAFAVSIVSMLGIVKLVGSRRSA